MVQLSLRSAQHGLRPRESFWTQQLMLPRRSMCVRTHCIRRIQNVPSPFFTTPLPPSGFLSAPLPLSYVTPLAFPPSNPLPPQLTPSNSPSPNPLISLHSIILSDMSKRAHPDLPDQDPHVRAHRSWSTKHMYMKKKLFSNRSREPSQPPKTHPRWMILDWLPALIGSF